MTPLESPAIEYRPGAAVAEAPEASARGRHMRTVAAIPCFNEELSVAGLVLRARRHVDQVIVVDDGSTDRTAEVAHLAGAIVLQHAHNIGKGAAVRTAFRFAASNGSKHLILIDGDGQHDPDEIPALLAPLRRPTDTPDVVFGFRFGDRTQMPLYRRMGKRVLDYATSVSSGGPVTDSQCGFRGFGPRAIAVMAERLHSQRFSVESETVTLARESGMRTENVPVTCRYDGIDGSSQNPVAHGTQVLNQLFVFLTMRRPLLTVGIPGLLLVLLASFWGLRMLQTYDDVGVFVMSYALAAATFAILGGIMIATALMLNMLILMRRTFPREE